MRRTGGSRWVAWLAAVTLALSMVTGLLAAPAAAAPAATGSLMIVLDSSGSMSQRLPGGAGTKIAAARSALHTVVARLPAQQPVGLRVYGATVFNRTHAGACTDSQRVVALGTGNRAALDRAVDRYRPYGETPIGYALQQAGHDLGGEGQRSIVLVSDGEPTCKPDPCPVAAALAKQGVSLHIDVVGLDVSGRARATLRCIARQGKGHYYDAEDAQDLSTALDHVASRAARPYLESGTPVRGGTTPVGAPALAPGDWLDELAGTGHRGDTRYYRLRRSVAGSTLHVSASLTTYRKADGVSIWLTRAGSQVQCESDYNVQQTAEYGALTTVSITAPRGRESFEQGCVTDQPLTLAVKHGLQHGGHSFGTADSVPVEIRVTEEPPVTSLNHLPATLATPHYRRPPSAPRSARIVGGDSFGSAALMAPGTFSGTLVPGEVQVFAVDLDWGQYLTDTVRVHLSRRLAGRLGTPWPGLTVRAFSPSREKADGTLALATNTSHQHPFLDFLTPYADGDEVYTFTDRVAYRNRTASSTDLTGASLRGRYLVAVSLQNNGGNRRSGSPNSLLSPGPLRTGRATFTASGSSKPPGRVFADPVGPTASRLAVGVHEAGGLIAAGFTQDDRCLA